MAFEELHSIPVSKVDTTIDIVGKGDGGHERDEVLVTSSVTLVSDLGSESVTLLLPLASDAQQKPVVRYTDEPLTGPAVFEFDEVERSEYDEQLVERLGRLADGSSKREQRDVAVSIGRCASSISAAVLQVKPGQRERLLAQGRELGYEYGCEAAASGVKLAETGKAVQFFRSQLAAAVRHHEGTEAGAQDADDLRVQQLIDQFLDEVLYAVLDGYEQCIT